MSCASDAWTSHEEASAAPLGLLRTRHERFEAADGELCLRLSFAAPLSKVGPVTVLYVLDPEPELFVLAAAHILGRAGYDADGSHDASPLQRLAVVGVGHHPSTFGGDDAGGWDVVRLRELRRAHFLRNEGGFLAALCESIVPHAEARLGLGAIAPEQRCLLGCSLSSLLALRSLIFFPGTFGHYILGSPSLPLGQSVFDEEKQQASVYGPVAEKHKTALLILAGEGGRARVAYGGHQQRPMRICWRYK